jgi:hypothetical protein
VQTGRARGEGAVARFAAAQLLLDQLAASQLLVGAGAKPFGLQPCALIRFAVGRALERARRVVGDEREQRRVVGRERVRSGVVDPHHRGDTTVDDQRNDDNRRERRRVIRRTPVLVRLLGRREHERRAAADALAHQRAGKKGRGRVARRKLVVPHRVRDGGGARVDGGHDACAPAQDVERLVQREFQRLA